MRIVDLLILLIHCKHCSDNEITIYFYNDNLECTVFIGSISDGLEFVKFSHNEFKNDIVVDYHGDFICSKFTIYCMEP